MTSPLADISEFAQARDYDSLVGRHNELGNEVEDLLTELEETLGPESELDKEQIKSIRQTYADVVQADLQDSLEGAYELEAFSEAVQEIQNDILEVLHNPKAETVVEDVDSWIVSTGQEPLSKEEKRGLREAILSDVEAGSTAVNKARTAHDSLRGDLGLIQEEIDERLRNELVAVKSPSDLKEISGALESLRDGWHGDWTLDYDNDIGAELNEEIWSVLISSLREDLEGRDSLHAVGVLVDNRSERIERVLSNINEAWSNVEAEYENLQASASYPDTKLLTLLRDHIKDDPSLTNYVSALNTVQSGLQTLVNIHNGSLDEFRSTSEPALENLQDPYQDIQTALDRAESAQEDALGAESVSDIEELEDEFDECVADAEDARDLLQSRLAEKVKTVRRLTEKFDIKTEETLSELYTDTISQDSVNRLLELSEVCSTVYSDVRQQVREDLPEAQAQLLEDLLALSPSATENLSLSDIQSEVGEEYGDELVETLLGLQDHELLEIEISVS